MVDNGSSHQQHGSARLDLGSSPAATFYAECSRYDSDTMAALRSSSIPLLDDNDSPTIEVAPRADDYRLAHNVHVSAQDQEEAVVASLPLRYDNEHSPHTRVALTTRQMPQDRHRHEDESLHGYECFGNGSEAPVTTNLLLNQQNAAGVDQAFDSLFLWSIEALGKDASNGGPSFHFGQQQRGRRHKKEPRREEMLDNVAFHTHPSPSRFHSSIFPPILATPMIESETMGKPPFSMFQPPQVTAWAQPPQVTAWARSEVPSRQTFPRALSEYNNNSSNNNNNFNGTASRSVSLTSIDESEFNPSSTRIDPRPEGRYREYQQDKWLECFTELQEFIQATGRTFIPNDCSGKEGLARWAKRQRYQYKLRNEGKTNSLSDERVELLNSVGFIWSAHIATFEERLYELQRFKEQMGHCNVPSQYPLNQKLSTWVKCQRRQYKLLMAGRRSNMTHERVEILNNHDFIWEIRKHSPPHQQK